MRPYGSEYLMASFDMRAPEPDPVAALIELAIDHGAFDMADVAIAVLDELDGNPDLEDDNEDGGDRHEENTGLSQNETLRISLECKTCGNVHSCEEIYIS